MAVRNIRMVNDMTLAVDVIIGSKFDGKQADQPKREESRRWTTVSTPIVLENWRS